MHARPCASVATRRSVLAVAGCSPKPAEILLFDGRGTSSEDVEAIKKLLEDNRLTYTTAGTLQLNRLGVRQLAAYRLLIVPGGNFVHMGEGLNMSTTANVRQAVNDGMNYLGICAGALLAGKYPLPYRSFDLAAGTKFSFYSVVNSGIHKTVVRVSTPAGPALDQYWEDGPELTGWGAVVAMYPDAKPAVVEGALGRGWVILSGIHPEAPERWRRGLEFHTPVAVDHAYALELIEAALHRKVLAHY